MPQSSKFNAKDYNFVAKRIRENLEMAFAIDKDDDLEQIQGTRRFRASGGLVGLALDFAKHYLKDNEAFEPEKFLDACSPNVELFPLGELWDYDNL